MPSGLFVCGLALSLGEVVSIRQQIATSSAIDAVQAINGLLQGRHMGTEKLLHQISEYANAAVTPGAADGFGDALKAVEKNIEAQVEKKIKEGQTATQGKLDSLIKGLDHSNAAANTAKTTAVNNDKSWFECVYKEHGLRKGVERADQDLIDATQKKTEACQAQDDSKGFKFDATGKYKLDFACDHSVAGSCAAALKTFQETVVQKMAAEAEKSTQSGEQKYKALAAECQAWTVKRDRAQVQLESVVKGWNGTRAECAKLAKQRESSMCAFGAQAQAKCSAEAKFAKLVAATKKAKGDADSEVDRENEWLASHSTRCMITKAIKKGLDAPVVGADLDACAAQANFDKNVGKLNTKQAEFAKLSKANACVSGAITFFNGETWNVPTSAKPSSKSYTTAKFTPQLDPTSGNFDFCSAPAPAPVPKAKPTCTNEGTWNGNGLPFRIGFKIKVSSTWSRNSANYLLGSNYRPYMNLYADAKMLFQFNQGGGFFGYKTQLKEDVEQYYEFVMMDKTSYKSYVDGVPVENSITGTHNFPSESNGVSFEALDTSAWFDRKNPVSFPTAAGYTTSDTTWTIPVSTASRYSCMQKEAVFEMKSFIGIGKPESMVRHDWKPDYDLGVMTIVLWVMTRTEGYHYLVSRGAWTEGYSIGVLARGDRGGCLRVWLREKVVCSQTTIAPHKWFHVALVFDGATESLFINGSLEANEKVLAPSNYTRTPLWIGGEALGLGHHTWAQHQPRHFLHGEMRDLRILRTALSPKAIARTFSQGVPE